MQPDELSLFYDFISALFSYPGTEKFNRLYDAGFRTALLDTARGADANAAEKGASLAQAVAAVIETLPDDPASGEEIYVTCFGHTVSRDSSPYELEHLPPSEVFAQTQKLADILGFYRAFGLDVGNLERADHVSVEAEFLSHLCAKEARADGDRAAVCREARVKFHRDHFSWWLPAFARGLAGPDKPRLYRQSAAFLEGYLKMAR